jgi:hypothetical protein
LLFHLIFKMAFWSYSAPICIGDSNDGNTLNTHSFISWCDPHTSPIRLRKGKLNYRSIEKCSQDQVLLIWTWLQNHSLKFPTVQNS